jgi:hypothetical protein
VDVYCAGPELLGADAREVYCGAAVHTWRHVGTANRLEGVGGNDADSCCFPSILGGRRWVIVVMIMRMAVGVIVALVAQVSLLDR